ncbi:MAG: hypothetical protein OCC49_12790 [Fibrobacterales bacterium]
MRFWLGLMVVVSLSSCLNSTDPAESSDSSSAAVLSGAISFTYTVPTANVPFTIDSISCTIKNDNAVIPLSIVNPQFSGENIPFEASANVGDSLIIEVELWRGDTLIATTDDSAIIEASTTIISGSIVNHLPTINAGADRSIYINKTSTFRDATVNEPDDAGYSIWWKSTTDSDFTQNSLTKLYKAIGSDTIVLLVIDGYGHRVTDTLIVSIIDYDYSVETPVSSSSSVMIVSSSTVSSSSIQSSSSVVLSSSSAVAVSSSSVVMSSSVAPVTYALTVEGGAGSGSYQAGEAVEIVANANDSGVCFKEWSGENVPNTTNDTTTIIMPAADKAVSASTHRCFLITFDHDYGYYETYTMDWASNMSFVWQDKSPLSHYPDIIEWLIPPIAWYAVPTVTLLPKNASGEYITVVSTPIQGASPALQDTITANLMVAMPIVIVEPPKLEPVLIIDTTAVGP